MMTKIEDADTTENWWGEEGAGAKNTYRETQSGPASVAYIADYYNRYPGEIVTFIARVLIREAVSDLTLHITLPKGLIVADYRLTTSQNGTISSNGVVPYIGEAQQQHDISWPLSGRLEPGSYEYKIEARVAPTPRDVELESEARLINADQSLLGREGALIIVRAKGQYLKYLPALYEQDELMGRFLMLFESFWAPLQSQIENSDYYFNPKMAPDAMLPWLAKWLDLELDQTWPEERLRDLIRWAIALHRSRGTKWGLLKYLELYTGQQAEILERRSNNFVIGKGARLGLGVALGKRNVPHTFTINLRLPKIEAESKAERVRQEKLQRRTIESIIDMQKPAHTVYTLNLEYVSLDDETIQQKPSQSKTGEANLLTQQAATWFNLDS